MRVLDCSVEVRRNTTGTYSAESGRSAWEQGHIAGAVFADLVSDLSERGIPLKFMMPPAEQFAEAMSCYGIGPGMWVVLYDRNRNEWAARVWWMLRAFGFEAASVLNGGFAKWRREGRPVSSDPPVHRPSRFVARPRPELFADKHEVLRSLDNERVRTWSGLSEQDHQGFNPDTQEWAGHIPGSVNVPYADLVDPDTNAFLAPSLLRDKLASGGVLAAERVITVCGWGIGASGQGLILTLLGHPNVAVYDGSMSEWTADQSLPLEFDTPD